MATIQRRETTKGTSFRVVWRDGSKQRVATFKSEDRAIRWKRLIEDVGGDEALADRKLAQRMDTGPQLSEVYDHHMKRHRGSKKTVQEYASYWRNHINPNLGDVPVGQIRSDDIRSLVSGMEQNDRAPKTIHNVCGFLAQVLTHAVTMDWIKVSPYDAKLLPKNRSVKPERNKFLTTMEANLIISGLRSPDPYAFMLATGLRPAEICALDVSDVNLTTSQPYVRVTKAVKQDRVDGDYIGEPKSTRSVRTVGLPPSAVAMLKAHTEGRRPASPLFMQGSGSNGSGKRVRLRRKRMYQNWQRRVVKLQKPGMDDQGNETPPSLTKNPELYALRHTHASLMLDAGMEIWQLSRHLGHSSVNVTEKHYAHLKPDAHYEAAQFAATFTTPAPQIAG